MSKRYNLTQLVNLSKQLMIYLICKNQRDFNSKYLSNLKLMLFNQVVVFIILTIFFRKWLPMIIKYLPKTFFNLFFNRMRTFENQLKSWKFLLMQLVIPMSMYSKFFIVLKENFSVSWFYCNLYTQLYLSLIHIWRCRRSTLCRSRWSPYH